MPPAIAAGNRPRQKSQRQRRRSHIYPAGSIFWLPKREALSNNGATTDDDDVEEGYYQHPVVVLSGAPQDGNVVVLIVRFTLPSSSLFTLPCDYIQPVGIMAKDPKTPC